MNGRKPTPWTAPRTRNVAATSSDRLLMTNARFQVGIPRFHALSRPCRDFEDRRIRSDDPADVPKRLVAIEPDGRGQIDLVHHDQLGGLEEDRVFERLVFS